MRDEELDHYLRERLHNPEDAFVERKSAGVLPADIAKAASAFANTLRGAEQAILFIGIDDISGDIIGVASDKIDKVQHLIQNVCAKHCHPPIQSVTSRVLRVEEKYIVAALFSASVDRPHFTGAAYVRQGASSVKTSADQLDALIASRLDKAERLMAWIGDVITIAGHDRHIIDSRLAPQHREQGEGKVIACDAHCVRFVLLLGGLPAHELAEPLAAIQISYDPVRRRPLMIVRPLS